QLAGEHLQLVGADAQPREDRDLRNVVFRERHGPGNPPVGTRRDRSGSPPGIEPSFRDLGSVRRRQSARFLRVLQGSRRGVPLRPGPIGLTAGPDLFYDLEAYQAPWTGLQPGIRPSYGEREANP